MIFASNGAEISICTTAQSSEPTLTEYQALTWVGINEVETLGTFGDTSEEIDFTAMTDARKRRIKGVRDAGTLDMAMGADYSDAGQIALIAAEKTIFDYAFKVVFNDAPQGGTPSERYFIATVASASESVETANSVVMLNCSLWVNSAITRVEAADP
ncbi:hypothetical protein [Sedimentitalea todarodis]|uniref:Phage tail protein n=1 Tax=Sedimentitalea todarodis TaxID=1631240 RepID=A0ABU3VHT6_9RHOB|nr:hypothetical protein [Sedimentitalea todarodis]MDU9005749.1 hypothetical protein [Sedimentitalea todarodis]